MNYSKENHEGEKYAPERSRTFSYDVNQQASSLVRWDQHYDQHSNGSFNGYLDELTLGEVHLFEEFTNQSLTQQCCVNENSLWLGFSLQSRELKINNHHVTDSQIMLRPSGLDFELITPQNFHIFGLVIDKSCLADHMIACDAEQWLSTDAMPLMTEKNSYVSYELSKLIQQLLSNDSPFSKTLPMDEKQSRITRLKPLITSRIADLLVQAKPSKEDLSHHHSTKWRIIDKIQAYIEETGQYPLTITELCKIAYVSRRTLQYCFENEFGCSPIQYLRDCRLNEIRRRLLVLNSDAVISDLALEYGFYHVSTFNDHYKRLFGETPTQTINRSSTYQHSSIIS